MSIEAIRARHVEYDRPGDSLRWCEECVSAWPCDAIRLLDVAMAAAALVVWMEADDVGWLPGFVVDDLRDALAALGGGP